MDNGPPARARRKKEEDGRMMRMRRGEEWVMPMMIGELGTLRLTMMAVAVNDVEMLMMMEEAIDGGCLKMVEGKVGAWMMKRMSGGEMKS